MMGIRSLFVWREKKIDGERKSESIELVLLERKFDFHINEENFT